MSTLWIRIAALIGMAIYMLMNPVEDLYRMFFVGFLLATALWCLAKGFPVTTSGTLNSIDRGESK